MRLPVCGSLVSGTARDEKIAVWLEYWRDCSNTSSIPVWHGIAYSKEPYYLPYSVSYTQSGTGAVLERYGDGMGTVWQEIGAAVWERYGMVGFGMWERYGSSI